MRLTTNDKTENALSTFHSYRRPALDLKFSDYLLQLKLENKKQTYDNNNDALILEDTPLAYPVTVHDDTARRCWNKQYTQREADEVARRAEKYSITLTVFIKICSPMTGYD